MKHSLLLHPLNLVSLLTRLWLDDIFNLFVQRSLAYWGKKKRERWLGRKMSRHRNTFVSGRVRYVAVIYGSTYVCDMKGHSSRSSSERGSRMLAECWQKNFNATLGQYITVDVPLWRGEALSTHPPRTLRILDVGIKVHRRCPLKCSMMSTKIWLNKGSKQKSASKTLKQRYSLYSAG